MRLQSPTIVQYMDIIAILKIKHSIRQMMQYSIVHHIKHINHTYAFRVAVPGRSSLKPHADS